MPVKSIAECSKGSILQYFRPSLSYHLSLRSLFYLFFSGRFTQVLLYFFGDGQLHMVRILDCFLKLCYFIFFCFSHGHARTQVMLMPRALKQKPKLQAKPSSTPVTQNASESSSDTKTETGTKTTGMSNSDFRNLLLKK